MLRTRDTHAKETEADGNFAPVSHCTEISSKWIRVLIQNLKFMGTLSLEPKAGNSQKRKAGNDGWGYTR